MKTIKDFSEGAVKQYNNLVANGYYLKPCIFSNTTIYAICKDTGNNSRTLFGETNTKTAVMLSKIFGFEIKEGIDYFGKAQPVTGYNILQEIYESEVTNLLE